MDDNRAIIIIGDKATGMDRMAAEMAMKISQMYSELAKHSVRD